MRGDLFQEHDINDLFNSLPEKPNNYFDFPASLYAFVRSLSYSNLLIEKIEEGFIISRETNKKRVVVSYTCDDNSFLSYLKEVSKYKKITTVNFMKDISDILPIKKYGFEFIAKEDFSLDYVLSNLKGKRKQSMSWMYRKSFLKYDLDFNVLKKEVLEVFDSWCEGASKRHFMVFKGHYLKYIEDYFNNIFSSVNMMGFRCKDSGILFGVSGWETYKGKAQITLMKHRFGDNNFVYFFWIKTIEKILDDLKISKVFCGSTADQLKKRIGLSSINSYKVILKK